MVKLYSLLSVYNGVETAYDCLTALSRFVDKIVVLEGLWIGYPDNWSLRSTDGTLQEIDRFLMDQPINTKCQIKFMVSICRLHQFEQRNILLSQVPENEWFIYIDIDEIVIKYPQDIPKLLADADSKNITQICVAYCEKPNSPNQARVMDIPRILKKTPNMIVEKNHRYYRDINGPVIYGKNVLRCPEFIFEHRGDKAMRAESEKYKKWLHGWEVAQEEKPKKKMRKCPKCGIECEEGSYEYQVGCCLYCGNSLINEGENFK